MMRNFFSLIFFISMLILTGCVQKSQRSKIPIHSLNNTELFNLIVITNKITGYNSFQRSDYKYLLNTRKWLEEDFSIGFAKLLKLIKRENFIEETWDCEQFSELAKVYAAILHANTPNRPDDAGLAFGVVDYIPDNNLIPHSINIVVVFENGRYDILYYEPQQREVIELSSWEIHNVLSIRF